MKNLLAWMKENRWSNQKLGDEVSCSAAQISRVKHGVCGVSLKLAKRLQAVTGIPWTEFVEQTARLKKKRAA
jgi:transcriptional regulator with XRE-family HTH domain